MNCNNCGNQNVNSNFCPKCGNLLVQNNLNQQNIENKISTNNNVPQNNEEKISKKSNKTKWIIPLVIIALLVTIGIGYIMSQKDKTEEKDEKETMLLATEKLQDDYESGKINTDQYVKYHIYLKYDRELLPEEYANLKNPEYNHLEDLIDKYYENLSQETLIYYWQKINLDSVTFELGKENVEQTSLKEILIDKVYAAEESVTNLDNAYLSEKGNFVIWYTQSGKSKTTKETVINISKLLEAAIADYDVIFKTQYKFNSKIIKSGKKYQNQKKILSNSGIDSSKLDNALQVYLIEYDNDSYATYVFGTKEDGLWEKILSLITHGDPNGSVLFPYMMIKPSSTKNIESLGEYANHELFHHYQNQIFCDNCQITDDFIKEATATWASSYITENTYGNLVINDRNNLASYYCQGLISTKSKSLLDPQNIGYASFSYLYNYAEYVNDGISKILDSIYKEDGAKYLHYSSTDKERSLMFENIAYKNLAQNYENKNLNINPNGEKKLNIKKKINEPFNENNIEIYSTGLHYYLLPYDDKLEYEINLFDLKNISIYVISKNNNEYKLIDSIHNTSSNITLNTNKYNDYDEIYIIICNYSFIESTNYSINIKNVNKIQNNNEYHTSFNNYNIEIKVNLNMSGLEVSSISSGTVDELHQKQYLKQNTNTMGITVSNEIYYDYISGITYMTKPFMNSWYKEKGVNQSVDLNHILQKLINMENVTKISENHYKIKMTKNDVSNIFNNNNIDTNLIKGDIFVDVYTSNGYITKLSYEFTNLIPNAEKFNVTISFSNYNSAGDVVIPKNIIDNAKFME